MEFYELKELGLRVFWDPPAGSEDTLADYIHQHSFYELHILLENRCELQVGGILLTVEQGAFCLIAPGVSHATLTPASRFRRHILCFEEIRPEKALGRHLARWAESEPVSVGQVPLLAQLAERLKTDGQPFSREYDRALLSLMLVELARDRCPIQSPAASAATPDEARTLVMDDFLNRHFSENGAEDRLAAALGLSRRQLDRVMRSRYGMGYREKIARIRLEVAKDLLGRTELSVQAVGERVGYANASNFTVFFKRCTGRTPTEYRKSLRM